MKEIIRGRAWVFGDSVTTDEILPSKWKTKSIEMKELAKHAFEPVRPEISSSIKDGDMIIGGRNFGFGSSREQAALAIRGLGVRVLIAESYARIFYRNCINVGIYPIECVSCRDFIKDLETVTVAFDKKKITNDSSGISKDFAPLPEYMESIIDSGNLVEFAKNEPIGGSPFSRYLR